MAALLSFNSLKKLGLWYLAYEVVTFLAFLAFGAFSFGLT